jgi:hypothetical protein
MGLSLSQIVTLLAIVLPLGAVPSRAMVGRWVQAAAAQAGRLLIADFRGAKSTHIPHGKPQRFQGKRRLFVRGFSA